MNDYKESRLGLSCQASKEQEIEFLIQDFFPKFDRSEIQSISKSADPQADFKKHFQEQRNGFENQIDSIDPTSPFRSNLLRTVESLTSRALGAIPEAFPPEFRRWDSCVKNFDVKINPTNFSDGRFLFRMFEGFFAEFPAVTMGFSRQGWTLCVVKEAVELNPRDKAADDDSHPVLHNGPGRVFTATDFEPICKVQFDPDLAEKVFASAMDQIEETFSASFSGGIKRQFQPVK